MKRGVSAAADADPLTSVPPPAARGSAAAKLPARDCLWAQRRRVGRCPDPPRRPSSSERQARAWSTLRRDCAGPCRGCLASGGRRPEGCIRGLYGRLVCFCLEPCDRVSIRGSCVLIFSCLSIFANKIGHQPARVALPAATAAAAASCSRPKEHC